MLIRFGKSEDYKAVENIAKQVQELHVEFRPDIYHSVKTVIDEITYEEYVVSKNIVVAQQDDVIAGLAFDTQTSSLELIISNRIISNEL